MEDLLQLLNLREVTFSALFVAALLAMYRLTSKVAWKWVNDNAGFLDGVADRHDKQLQQCIKHGAAIEQLTSKYEEPQEFSTVQTNQALAAVIDAEITKIKAQPTIEDGEKVRLERLLMEAKTRLETSHRE